MSLVSAVKDNNPKDGKKKKQQAQQKPLSREAMYRAKMKYGVYQSPANIHSVGVPDAARASDSAAVLAHTSQQTVEAYKRLLDPNATKAAHAVAKGARSRSSSHSSAALATPRVYKEPVPRAKATAAASKAFSLTSNREEALGLGYTHSQDRAYSIGGANTVLKHLQQQQEHEPEPVVSPVKQMNLSKVLKGAETRAHTRVKERTQPHAQNFSYGIKTDAAKNNQFVLSKDMMNTIMAKTGTGYAATGIEPKVKTVVSKKNKNKNANASTDAMSAAYAVRDFDTRTAVDDEIEKEQEKQSLYLKQLTSTKVLAKARANVDREIQNIEKEDYGRQLFANDSYNRTAVSIAQKNLTQKRAVAATYNNKINMGGGLWLTPDDIQQISQNLLNPVLGEITERADAQRAADIDIDQRQKALQAAVRGWNVLQTEKLANDVKYKADSDARVAKARSDAQQQAQARYSEMTTKMDAELAAHNDDLNKTKQMLEDLKLEMSMKLDLQQEFAEKELSSWQETRATDISDALTEQKEMLQPYLLDLQRAQDDNDKLSKEYDALGGRITFLHEQIDKHKDNIEQYNHDLEAQRAREARDIEAKGQLDNNKEQLTDELDNTVTIKANQAKEAAELSAKQLELKQLEIDAAINERRSELNKAEIALQKERLTLIDVMKESAELNGDAELDEEKVKALIGMTSGEYLSKHIPKPTVDASEVVQLTGTAAAAATAANVAAIGTGTGAVAENVLDVPIAKTVEPVVKAASETVPAVAATAPAQAKSTIVPALEKTTTNASRRSSKFGLGNLFIGSRSAHDAKKRRESVSHSDEASVPAVAKSEVEPVVKKQAENVSAPVADNTIAPSFSGFSQGSIVETEPVNDTVASMRGDTIAPETLDADDDDDIHINGEPNAAASGPDGYLKEVF